MVVQRLRDHVLLVLWDSKDLVLHFTVDNIRRIYYLQVVVSTVN